MPMDRRVSGPFFSGQNPHLRRLVLAVLTVLASSMLAVVPSATATTAHHKHHKHHKRHSRRAGARTASGCSGANDPVAGTPPQVLKGAVVCLINQQRALRHLPALSASPLLNRSAQGWTNVMVSSDEFTHGTNFASRIGATGYDWRMAGENIATGFATPRGVVRAWMASTGHCQNILNPAYRNVGTGVSARPVRGYATGAGTWTQDFALGMKSAPASNNFGPADGCPY
jgi:uncharacterized protein YkwD